MVLRGIKRRQRGQTDGKRFLIACEGEKTEVRYFESIRRSLRLQSARIAVIKPDGTDPYSVVSAAMFMKKKAIDEQRWNPTLDTAWAVFDGDEHITNKAL